MKKFKIIFSTIILCVAVISCSKPDNLNQSIDGLGNSASNGFSKIFDISTDNSGLVKITPLGNGITSSIVTFGHGTGATATATVNVGGTVSHIYPEGTYTVSIASVDAAGNQTVNTYPITVTYRAPENVTIALGADMKVGGTALYAKSFLVYYGDVANEVGTPMAATVNATTALATATQLPAHIYPAGGPYTMRLVALSGGVATTSVSKVLFGLPVTFDNATVPYFFGGFGNASIATVANPNMTGNTTANVGIYTKNVGANTWSGTYSPLNIPINFALGNKIKVMVYNPSAALIGKKLNVELESQIAGTGATANGVGVLKVPFTTSGAWEELTFDFSTIAAINQATARYGQIVFRFDDTLAGTGEVFYIDNIRQSF